MKNLKPKPVAAALHEQGHSPVDVDSKPTPAESSRAPRRTKAILARKDGRELRRMTIYLPPDLARRLKVYAAGADMDISRALAEKIYHELH